jgi:DNA-binding response OmpR family regulator
VRLLLIEDDTSCIEDVLENLESQYIVDVAYNGVEGTYLSQVNDYDAILIDSSLPDMDGTDVCVKTRNQSITTPIMILSDNENSEYKLLSLEVGADAYLDKPLDSSELTTFLRVLTRRNKVGCCTSMVTWGPLSLDMRYKEVKMFDKIVHLKRKEYKLIEYLALSQGRVVSREELLEHLWPDGLYILSNTVDVHISRLRSKLEKPFGLRLIQTVYGFGYRLRKIS